jgi:hypothetical protein
VRNYPQFLAFVVAVWLGGVVLLATSVHILLSWVLLGAHTDLYLLRVAVLVVNISWACTVLCLVGSLLAFHLYLICRGQTTNEYFREKRLRSPLSAGGGAALKFARIKSLLAGWIGFVCICLGVLPTQSAPIAASEQPSHPGSDASPSAASHPAPQDAEPQAAVNTCPQPEMQGLTDAAAELLLTPLYDADSTPFPQLSPSPLSPSDGFEHTLIPEWREPALSPVEEGVWETEHTSLSGPTLQTGDSSTIYESVPSPPPSYPADRRRATCCLCCHTGTQRSARLRQRDTARRRHYPYPCYCVPIVPPSRLLPMWQREDEADARQQEELLQLLFQRITEALTREADELEGDVSV